MINLKEIGTTYTIISKLGIHKEFHIIYLEDFLSLIGKFDENHFPEYGDYLSNVIDSLSGFVSSPCDITWYARTSEKSDFSEAIKLAVRQGNTVIMLEILE